MSTNSAICEPYGDTIRGRHCQWDGHPTWVGRQLWTLVSRDGLDVVRKTMLHDHYGWSQLHAEWPELTPLLLKRAAKLTPEERVDLDYDTPLYRAAQFDNDGRFESVTGYGIAYTDTLIPSMGAGYRQVQADAWVRTYDYEWTYVLTDSALWICRGDEQPLDQVLWEGPEPDWQAIEGRIYALEGG